MRDNRKIGLADLKDIIKKYDEYNYSMCFRHLKKDNIEIFRMLVDNDNYTYLEKAMSDASNRFNINLYGYFNECRVFASNIVSNYDRGNIYGYEKDAINDTVENGAYYFLLLAIIYKIYDSSINTNAFEKELNLDYINRLLQSDSGLWFRGQSNCNWYMTPSMIRDVRNNVVLDSGFLTYKYNRFGLVKKFNNLIGSNQPTSYEFLSFMQHSCEYSPLVDVSKNPIIASTFALANKNKFDSYYTDDSKLFIISESKKDASFETIISDKKSYIYANKALPLGSTIDFDEYDIKGNKTTVSLKLTKIKNLINMLRPEFIIVKEPTSDRMKYQKGGFILFYDYLSIGGRIFYDLNDKLNYREIVIKCNQKDAIRDYIEKNHFYYDYEHLLNPYKYFNE